MSHSDQAITIREVADVFLEHEAKYDRADVTLPDQLVRDIADDLIGCRGSANQATPRSGWWHGFDEAGAANVYNAVYMLDEKPFAYLPHHQANQIQYFMRRFRNSGGWKLIFPWRKP